MADFSNLCSFYVNSLLRNTLVLKQKISCWLASILSVTIALPAFAQDLVVYTYDSFNTEWGPGPVVFKAFEEQCSCKGSSDRPRGLRFCNEPDDSRKSQSQGRRAVGRQ